MTELVSHCLTIRLYWSSIFGLQFT